MLQWFETAYWQTMIITDIFDRLKLQNQYLWAIIISVISGALYSLGFPSSLLPTSMLFSHLGVCFFFFIVTKYSAHFSFRKIMFLTLIFSIAHNFMGFYWISYTLEIFGGLTFPWNKILSTLFSIIVIPYYFILSSAIYFRNKILQRIPKILKNFPIFLSILAVLLENFFPQQFPAHLGHTWMHLAPYLGLAPFGGAPLFSFVSYFLIFSLIDFCFDRDKKTIVLPLITTSLFVIINVALPLSSTIWKEKNQRKIDIRLVQGNIGNFLKISAEGGLQSSIAEVYKDFYELSLKNLPSDNDIIIWPETAYPRLLNASLMKNNLNSIPELVQRILINSKSSLLFGGYDFAKNEDESLPEGFMTEYNAAFYIGFDKNLNQPKFQNVYHKIKLIPFGEGLPFGPLNSFFGKYIQNISFFAEGPGPEIFTTPEGIKFFTIICYETLFNSFIRNFVLNFPKADFIVNITNDSWYGRTSEPFQHLFLAKWRALEFQLPMVRMTNTGITSVVYPDGSESTRSALFQKIFQDHKIYLPEKNGITPFAKFGHWIWLSLAFVLMVMNYFLRTNPSRSKS